MSSRRTVVLLILVLLSVMPIWPSSGHSSANATGLDRLFERGYWQQLMARAVVWLHQVPLAPEAALVAAAATREIGDHEASIAMLSRATAATGGLQQVARVELAELILAKDPARAVETVLPVLQRPETRQLRETAVWVAAAAVVAGLDSDLHAQVEKVCTKLPRRARRELELALALTDAKQRQQRLAKLIADSTRDLNALTAAQCLQREPGLGELERWHVAKTLYGHALYQEAEPVFEGLLHAGERSIRAWEVRYLRGRCAFRRGRWSEAGNWYRQALAKATRSEDRASMEVHQARTLELDGKLAEATEAARRAVIIKTTDERRLFLARLRLRQNQPGHAAVGISRIRSYSARERGQILLALDELRRGQPEAALARLQRIRHHRWQGPAQVLSGRILADQGRWGDARVVIEEIAPGLDGYWGIRARALLAGLPEKEVAALRQRRQAELSSASERTLQRALARWSALDIDPARLVEVQQMVAAEGALDGAPQPFAPGLADQLRQLGLEAMAARWAPDGFPKKDAAALLWSASKFLELGLPRRAIQTSDAAWRKAGSRISVRAYSEQLRRALYPLPYEELVRTSAAQADMPWALLAGIVREESRWERTVVSVVGARGLTQMMPATAAGIAASLGAPEPTPDDLFTPEVALRLGAAELARLLERFGGRAAPAVAAYNAGEAQAKLWLEQCGGDSCTEERYILGISFDVTRGYTTEVLASASLYAELY